MSVSLKGRLLEELSKMDKNETFDKDFISKASRKLIKNPYNLILLTDAYKYSHHKFYEEGTSKIGSYLESRGGNFDKLVFYGLQYFLKRYLSDVAITKEDVDEAEHVLSGEDGVFSRTDVFDRSKFDYIVEKHGGKLPVRIKALKEGTIAKPGVALMYIENTDDKCAWLTNFLEPLLLQVWYPIVVATLSKLVKNIVSNYFDKSTAYNQDTKDFIIGYVLNDFGFRGVSSVESASVGGSAHLVNFDGSDNIVASLFAKDYYNITKMFGKSVPATEHSIMTIKGNLGEIDMMKRVLCQYPTGIVACVSDSYDIKRSIKLWGTELKDLILSRPSEPGNQLVIRPDSGHVLNTLKYIFTELFEHFGYTVNEKGYKVLPPQIRVIQGDGVNLNSIIDIYKMLEEEKISADNLALGMGGKLLQADINRDTCKFATKACFAIVNGEVRNVVKSPTEITENGEYLPSFKTSKQGLPKTYFDENGNMATTTSISDIFEDVTDLMEWVFEDGDLLKEYTFDEVRENSNIA